MQCNYHINDRILYNPTFSTNEENYHYGSIVDIKDMYLYIQFDNNYKIFEILCTNVSLINKKNKKIIITI
jgi:hypothetical protein